MVFSSRAKVEVVFVFYQFRNTAGSYIICPTSSVLHRRNCILADEMGLGKTIQSITFLYEIYMKGIEGPFLVIAPLSTIPNWEREFRTWTELNAVVYHGSQASRKTIQAYEMYYRETQVTGRRRSPVVLTKRGVETLEGDVAQHNCSFFSSHYLTSPVTPEQDMLEIKEHV